MNIPLLVVGSFVTLGSAPVAQREFNKGFMHRNNSLLYSVSFTLMFFGFALIGIGIGL